MSDLIVQGTRWLSSRLQAVVSHSVLFKRSTIAASLELYILATIAQTAIDAESDPDGLLTRYQMRDYIIPATALRVYGTDVVPVPGDRFVEGDGGIYEVMAIPGKGAWDWHDRHHVMRRVHTKRVNAVYGI